MKFKTVIFFITFTLAIANKCNSQCLTINLIKNPSLEEYSCSPINTTMIGCADYWHQPDSLSTTDYFNSCSIDSLLVPTDLPYYEKSYFGNGYAGIIPYINCGSYSRREYLQGELSEPLVQSRCYHVEFWTLLSEHSRSAIDALGVYFSDTLPKKNNCHQPFNFPAQINNPQNNILRDSMSWTKISGDFYAKGGEQFFTIGTFKIQTDINVIYFYNPDYVGPEYKYYFFDNFSLCPCEDTMARIEPMAEVVIPNVFTPNKDGRNDEFIVNGQGLESLHLVIYNRWGNKIFESNGSKQGWDGKYKGNDCEAGVYFWVAELVYKNGKHEKKQGTVTLIR